MVLDVRQVSIPYGVCGKLSVKWKPLAGPDDDGTGEPAMIEVTNGGEDDGTRRAERAARTARRARRVQPAFSPPTRERGGVETERAGDARRARRRSAERRPATTTSRSRAR